MEGTIFERHFSPRTLSEIWGYSTDTILRWFRDEDGVLRSGDKAGEGDMRIPQSVAERVYRQKTKKVA
jgi:hypothetical protein